EAGQGVRHPAGPEQIAIQLEGAGPQNCGAHAGQPEMQRVVDGDRAGRKAVEPKPTVAPRLAAGPAERLGDIALRPVAERVEAAVTGPGPPNLDEQVVVGGAV